ncbi:hypothetical protein DYQ05_10475 [Treponema pedis]|nr:hypothetical protein DYQ05_10475 [Treponema pedis]
MITDHIGRPIQAIDDNGELVWSCDYDIYGRLKKLKGERTFIPFRQVGQIEDAELEGLYYNRYRWYNSETGCYISQDPIGLAGNNPTLYAFVKNVNTEVDVFGLRGLWKLTTEGTSKKRTIGQHTYYQHKSTGLWWSIDTAKHGGSAFKVFKEGKGGVLEWYRDADKYGDFINPNKKHKGAKGKKVCGG